MFLFLIPLLLGFLLDCTSAFTSTFSRRWGKRKGQLICLILGDVLGIPLWVTGLTVAVREPAPVLFSTSPVTEALA